MLSAQADAVCCAGYGERSPERVNSRNGYRHRDLDTRVGTLDVAVPKLRTGSLYPEWLLERRKRAERALTSVVATCYLLGVSTRRMDKLVQTLGITGLSKSQVSVMAKELDEHVEQFRTRRLEDAGPFTFVAADALVLKVREGGRVVPVHVPQAGCPFLDGLHDIAQHGDVLFHALDAALSELRARAIEEMRRSPDGAERTAAIGGIEQIDGYVAHTAGRGRRIAAEADDVPSGIGGKHLDEALGDGAGSARYNGRAPLASFLGSGHSLTSRWKKTRTACTNWRASAACCNCRCSCSRRGASGTWSLHSARWPN